MTPAARIVVGVAALVAVAIHPAAQTPSDLDPFGFLGSYVRVDRRDRRDMVEREVVSKTLDATGREVAVFVASTIDIGPEQLIRKIRNIEALRTSRIVPTVRRFSDPPEIEDLRELVLDAKDLEGLENCRPGDCDLKLAAVEIERLQRAAAAAGDDRETSVQEEFRRIVLERVNTYLTGGRRALPNYHDKDVPVAPDVVFSALLGGFDCLHVREPEFARYLNEFPRVPHAGVEAFLYWSIETYAPKTIITVWQEHVLRRTAGPGEPDVWIAGTQLFATHYLDGAVSLTMLTRGDGDPAPRYLTYVNRASVDILDGFMTGVRRFLLQRRLRSDSRRIFDTQRRRLEEGQ